MTTQAVQQKIVHLTLALAGIFQAAKLVRDFARLGSVDEEAFQASIKSIYKIESNTVADVYGGPAKLRLGLTELIQLLSYEKINVDRDVTRYLIRLMHLERKLRRAPEIQKQLARRIKHASSAAQSFSGLQQKNNIVGLADIYTSTLGNLPMRLHVLGNPNYLGQTEIVNKIRAVLLAGVRSVVLWRQMGGSRLHFLLCRKKLLQNAQAIVTKL